MKNAKEYAAQPYTKVVRWNPDDELFVARIKEVDECTAHGVTEAQALERLGESFEDWIQFALDEGIPIPNPDNAADLPSGKWLQRVPRSLHKQLIDRAAYEGVSLNSYVSNALAMTVGAGQAEPNKAESVNLKASAGEIKVLPSDSLSCWFPLQQAGWGTPKFVAVVSNRNTKKVVYPAQKGHRTSPVQPYAAFVTSMSGAIPTHQMSVLAGKEKGEDIEEGYEIPAYA